jgi:hypothetical protein
VEDILKKTMRKGGIMSGGSGLGFGSDSFVEKIKMFSELPADGCPAGDHSVEKVVSPLQKKEYKGSAVLVGHCPLSEEKLPIK